MLTDNAEPRWRNRRVETVLQRYVFAVFDVPSSINLGLAGWRGPYQSSPCPTDDCSRRCA